MTGTTQMIQIRYKKESTKIDFLEVRAHFSSHEDAIIALVKFWKDNNKPVMKGSIT